MTVEDYRKGMRYEMLIRHTYNCPSGMRSGAHQSFMSNLIMAEKGSSSVSHLGSVDKYFSKHKNYISKALIKLSKTNPYKGSSGFFLRLDNDREQLFI